MIDIQSAAVKPKEGERRECGNLMNPVEGRKVRGGGQQRKRMVNGGKKTKIIKIIPTI